MTAIFKIVAALLPASIMMWLDNDLSSAVHIPIIGITAICVALCDALFGQIVANTRWIPFSGCYTPAEAQELASKFRTYHTRLFGSWMIVKVCSSIAITTSATMIIKNLPRYIEQYRTWILCGGYLALGTSIVMAIDFVFTYFHAADKSDEARLREMNYTYQKEHPELFAQDTETVKRQLEGFGSGYTSNPITAETV